MSVTFHSHNRDIPKVGPCKVGQMVDLAGTLESVMAAKGLTNADVASAAGIQSADTVRRWRDGRTNLTERKLARVLVAVGEDPTIHGLPPAPEPPAPAWAKALDRKLDAMATQLELLIQQTRPR